MTPARVLAPEQVWNSGFSIQALGSTAVGVWRADLRLAADSVPASAKRDEADIVNGAIYHPRVAGFVEAALEIRKAIAPDEIARAVAIDEALLGSNDRADYITSVAENGGLSVAALRGDVQAFCCLDHGYFFGKPFISLLVVAPDARRLGLGAGLLSHNSSAYRELWTSTNQSNSAMRKLLDKAGWQYCGELSGLDEGDPERFYRTA